MKETEEEDESVVWKKSSNVLWVFQNVENYDGARVYRLRRAAKEG